MYVRKYYDLLVPLYLFIGLPSKVVVYKRQCTPGKYGFRIKETRNATRLSKKRAKKPYLSIPHSNLQEATSSATRKEWL